MKGARGLRIRDFVGTFPYRPVVPFSGLLVKSGSTCSGYSSAQMVLGGQMQPAGEATVWIKDSVAIEL